MESLAVPLTPQPRLSLALLTALNFFNYIDRSVLFAVQPLVKQEFHSTHANLGFSHHHDIQTLLFRHTVVGIGEASFATIASSRTSSKNATVGASSPFSLWPTRRAQPWVMC
jgi:hypothetical protein